MLNNRLVMAFGSFDGLHQGHHFFISEIKKLGNGIIVVIATDKNVEIIKKRPPRFELERRMDAFKAKYPGIKALLGDNELGEWSAIKKFKPDIVAVGYDQHGLKDALENSDIQPKPLIVQIIAHRPEIFKSSLL